MMDQLSIPEVIPRMPLTPLQQLPQISQEPTTTLKPLTAETSGCLTSNAKN